jgi:hypothetical protein
MKSLETYFKLYDGIPCLYSKIEKVAKPAVEVLIFDRKLVAQQRMFDSDELIVPSMEILRREILDDGDIYGH